MKRNNRLSIGLVVSAILISAGMALAQEPAIAPEAAVENQAAESEIQWLWGEVVSSDAANKTLVIKYLDYDTDQEKEAIVTVDEKTTYENIQFLDGIRPQDTLSIDYIVNAEGRNVAKNISLEKPEEALSSEPAAVVQPSPPANEPPQP